MLVLLHQITLNYVFTNSSTALCLQPQRIDHVCTAFNLYLQSTSLYFCVFCGQNARCITHILCAGGLHSSRHYQMSKAGIQRHDNADHHGNLLPPGQSLEPANQGHGWLYWRCRLQHQASAANNSCLLIFIFTMYSCNFFVFYSG